MSSELPSFMRAVVIQADKGISVQLKPVPQPWPNQILLKVTAVGLNPADWMQVEFFNNTGAILGCDAVGDVVALGREVSADLVKLGETRSVFIKGGHSQTNGAFAEYLACSVTMSSVVPNNVSALQAASVPCPVSTATHALYWALSLPEPTGTPSTVDSPWILIYSGGSAVAQFAIQLAKLSGLNVIATASPKRHQELRSLGADVVVDYREPDIVAKLKQATKDRISFGLDCYSQGGSLIVCQKAFQPSGGKLVSILFDISGLPRNDVETVAITSFNAIGEDLGDFKTNPAQVETQVRYQKIVSKLLRHGSLKTIQVDLIGGLEEVQKGLELIKTGKNEHKLVCQV